MLQVAQVDSGTSQTSSDESTKMVDVIELMAAVLEDSPSNRLTMLQTSGQTCCVVSLLHPALLQACIGAMTITDMCKLHCPCITMLPCITSLLRHTQTSSCNAVCEPVCPTYSRLSCYVYYTD